MFFAHRKPKTAAPSAGWDIVAAAALLIAKKVKGEEEMKGR
jgi:hypothetical protein